MDIAKELEEAEKKRVELINHINQMEQEKQLLIQEAFRCDGEVRLLQRLLEEQKNE